MDCGLPRKSKEQSSPRIIRRTKSDTSLEIEEGICQRFGWERRSPDRHIVNDLSQMRRFVAELLVGLWFLSRGANVQPQDDRSLA